MNLLVSLNLALYAFFISFIALIKREFKIKTNFASQNYYYSVLKSNVDVFIINTNSCLNPLYINKGIIRSFKS